MQLTGQDVRENHGVELAILYEEPAVGNEVLRWVSERDLGSGPYRWMIFERRGDPVLAYSGPFMAPARTGAQVTVRLMLAGYDERPP